MSRHFFLHRRDRWRAKQPRVLAHRAPPRYRVYLFNLGWPVSSQHRLTLAGGEITYSRVLYLSREQFREAMTHPRGLDVFARTNEHVVATLYGDFKAGHRVGPSDEGLAAR